MASQYKIYNALSKRIYKSGFHKNGSFKKFASYGTIATYLCELYLIHEGLVSKNHLLHLKVITEGQTNEFLTSLVKANFIKWDMQDNLQKKYPRYQTFSGPRLSDLINQESNAQFASKEEILIIKQELQFMKKVVFEIIDTYDPPASEEKYNKFKENVKIKQFIENIKRDKVNHNNEDD